MWGFCAQVVLLCFVECEAFEKEICWQSIEKEICRQCYICILIHLAGTMFSILLWWDLVLAESFGVCRFNLFNSSVLKVFGLSYSWHDCHFVCKIVRLYHKLWGPVPPTGNCAQCRNVAPNWDVQSAWCLNTYFQQNTKFNKRKNNRGDPKKCKTTSWQLANCLSLTSFVRVNDVACGRGLNT